MPGINTQISTTKKSTTIGSILEQHLNFIENTYNLTIKTSNVGLNLGKMTLVLTQYRKPKVCPATQF